MELSMYHKILQSVVLLFVIVLIQACSQPQNFFINDPELISLEKSADYVKVGDYIELQAVIDNPDTEPILFEWHDFGYGEFFDVNNSGNAKWRNTCDSLDYMQYIEISFSIFSSSGVQTCSAEVIMVNDIPALVGFLDLPGPKSWIETSGRISAVGMRDSGLELLDVSSTMNPRSLSNTAGYIRGPFTFERNVLYTSYMDIAFDITNYQEPDSLPTSNDARRFSNFIPGQNYGFAVHSSPEFGLCAVESVFPDTVYILSNLYFSGLSEYFDDIYSGLQLCGEYLIHNRIEAQYGYPPNDLYSIKTTIFNVGDIYNMYHISSLEYLGKGGSLVKNGYLYVPNGGLQIYKLHSANDPEEVLNLNEFEPQQIVLSNNNTIFGVDDNYRVVQYDVSIPEACEIIHQSNFAIDMPGYNNPPYLSAEGNFLYLADNDGVKIFWAPDM
jgi:hypothetical protein